MVVCDGVHCPGRGAFLSGGHGQGQNEQQRQAAAASPPPPHPAHMRSSSAGLLCRWRKKKHLSPHPPTLSPLPLPPPTPTPTGARVRAAPNGPLLQCGSGCWPVASPHASGVPQQRARHAWRTGLIMQACVAGLQWRSDCPLRARAARAAMARWLPSARMRWHRRCVRRPGQRGMPYAAQRCLTRPPPAHPPAKQRSASLQAGTSSHHTRPAHQRHHPRCDAPSPSCVCRAAAAL